MRTRWCLAATLLTFALAGCSPSVSGDFSGQSTDANLSAAYLDGYNGNLGASPALIGNYGGPSQYCQGVLLLHTYDTTLEENDYIQGCLDAIGADSSAVGGSDTGASDLLSRLSNVGGDSWSEDAFSLTDPPSGFVTDYIANGYCTLWVFQTGDLAESAAQGGFLDNFTSYSYSWGTDDSGLGVIAMYEDAYSACADDMLETLGWGNWP